MILSNFTRRYSSKILTLGILMISTTGVARGDCPSNGDYSAKPIRCFTTGKELAECRLSNAMACEDEAAVNSIAQTLPPTLSNF